MLTRKQMPEVLKKSPIDVWRDESWSPMRLPLSRMFDRFFNDFVGMTPSILGLEESLGSLPACDLKETDTHYLVSFDLPGVNKNDIQISIRDNLLSVSGERKEEKAKEEARGLGRERYYGAFQRSFTLSTSIDSEKVEANYQDGVLYITVPKAEAAKSKLIKVADGKPRLVIDKKEEKAA